MKIICDSCGSKYSIADTKVKGKRVKVRCKSCKTSILVDGTNMSSAGDDGDSSSEPEAAAVDSLPPTPGKAPLPKPAGRRDLWSVNLSNDDSREMSLDEIVKGWTSGLVGDDAYVWKDGMADWKPLLEVSEIAQKLPSKPKVAARPSVPKPSKDGSMSDMFGVDTLQKSAPLHAAAGEDDPKATGARNDSSVLFSLDALKAGVETADDEAAQASTDPFGVSSGGLGAFGGGGLLGGTAATDLLTAPAKDPPPAAPQAISAGPAISGNRKGAPKGLIIAAAVGLLAIGGAAFAMMGGSDSASAEAESAEQTAEAASKVAEEEEKKKMEEALKKAEEEKKAAAEEAAKKEEETKAEEEKKAEEEAKEATNSTSSSTTTAAPKTEKKEPAAAGPFNVGAAKTALATAAANAKSCAKPGGPTGRGKVMVTFKPSGRVTSAVVTGGAFGGTSVGGCVASVFRRATVPPFAGSSQTVAKSFTIN